MRPIKGYIAGMRKEIFKIQLLTGAIAHAPVRPCFKIGDKVEIAWDFNKKEVKDYWKLGAKNEIEEPTYEKEETYYYEED